MDQQTLNAAKSYTKKKISEIPTGSGISDLSTFTTDNLSESATKKYTSPSEKTIWNNKLDVTNIKPGTNITITTNENDVTINSTATGGISSQDQSKLDGIVTNGDGSTFKSNDGTYKSITVAGIVGSTGNIIVPSGSPTDIEPGEEIIFNHPLIEDNKMLVNIQQQILGQTITDTHIDFSDSSKYILQDSSKILFANNKVQLKDMQTISDTYFNPSDKGTSVTLSNNNLSANISGNSSSNNFSVRSNKYLTNGKWYFEVKINSFINANAICVGVANDSFLIASNNTSSTNQISYYSITGNIQPSNSAYGTNYTTNDVIGVAIDIDNKTIKFSKNGVWYNNLTLPTWTKYYAFLIGASSSSANSTLSTINYGATTFSYVIPTGYLPFGHKVTTTPTNFETTTETNLKLTTLTTLISIGSTVITPTNTNIKLLFSVDNKANWLYKDGTGIHVYTGDLTPNWTSSNQFSELQTYINNLPLTQLITDLSNLGINPVSLDFKVQLNTTDTTVTPSIGKITLVYQEADHTESASFGGYNETGVMFGVKGIRYIDYLEPTKLQSQALVVKNLSSTTKKANVILQLGI